MDSAVTIPANQSANVVEENEASEPQGSTFVGRESQLPDEKVDEVLIDKGVADPDDELLFGDLEGQMDDFVMQRKDELDRLKSVRLSKGLDNIKSNSILSKWSLAGKLSGEEKEIQDKVDFEFENRKRKGTVPN